MRKIAGITIAELAEKDKSIVVLDGDLGRGMFDKFKEIYPERYFNLGVCEQSMISVSAGMALEGLKPFVFSITPFLLERPFEQIKIDLDHQKAKVVLVGYADYPGMGPTHAELDWRVISQCFKNIKFFFPKTEAEAKDAMLEAYNYQGPAIISLKKAPATN